MKHVKAGLIGLGLAMSTLTGAAYAQDAQAAAKSNWVVTENHGAWNVICREDTPNFCRAIHSQDYAEDTSKGRLLEVVLQVEGERSFMILTLPFGLNLQSGLVIQIDNEQEHKLAFNTCFPSGCQAIIEMDEVVAAEFAKGKIMKVGFRAWGDEKTLVVEASLEGSSASYKSVKEKAKG